MMNTTNRDQIVFENIRMILGIYLIPMICIPGLIGNILCVVVFVKSPMQRFLTTEFLIYLASSDSIKLANDLLYSTVLIIELFNKIYANELFLILYRYCQFINSVSTSCTAWLTLIIAIERYTLCSTNSQTRLRIQKSSYFICNIIILLSVLISIPVIFRYEIISEKNNNLDSPSIRLSKFGSSRLFRLYSILFDLIRAIFPSLLLLYLNTRIVYLLSRKKSLVGTAFYRLTISLIIIIGCFICCYFPDALLSLILNMGYIDETYSKRAIREISDFFITINSATNFIIYFSISFTFRRSMLKLFERQRKLAYPTTYEDLIQRRRSQRRQPLYHYRYPY